MAERNINKPCYFKLGEICFDVFYDNKRVAKDLLQSQAAKLCDDLSYYGQAITCVYDESSPCKMVETNCINCPVGASKENKK